MSTLPEQPIERPSRWPLAPEPEPILGLPGVLFVFIGMLLALLVCGAVAIYVAHLLPTLRRLPMADLADNPRVLIPAQLVAYVVVVAVLWRFFSHHLRIGFARALQWCWPARPSLFLAIGFGLAVLVQFVAHFLPLPPGAPIDKMLQSPTDAWMMSLFGVLIAPFVEELLFRGLLFPALARSTGAFISLIATACAFGAVHAQQLGGSWIEVACIVFVGAVLTLVRWRAHSLASSTLVHVGYNGTLFVALFIQTHGFTQLSNH